MNFIAHLYLSGIDEGLIIGNFIADSIKGKNYLEYPAVIQRGILLHRHIDSFTDSHPIVHHSKSLISTKYGHYSGVVIDIFYDHFLTNNWSKYTKESLSDFSTRNIDVLVRNKNHIPDLQLMFLDYIITNDRINTYKEIDVMNKVFRSMAQRTNSNIHDAIEALILNYAPLGSDFTLFFDDLKNSCEEFINEHL